MLWASFLFTLMSACVKALPTIPAVELVWFRSLISIVLCLVALKKNKIPFFGNNKKVLVARGLFGAVSLMVTYNVVQNIPLATSSVLHYVSPIFTALIAFLVLGEKLYKIQWLFFAISFAGVLIMKGFDSRVETLYLCLGIVAAFLAACAYNCIRVLKDSEHPLVIVFYFPLVTLPITSAICLFDWVTPTGWQEWGLILAIGLLTQLAQLAMTKAYQAEEAAKIASVSYTGIIHAIIVGIIFFQEYFDWKVIAGMCLVLVGVILNVSFKRVFRVK